MPRFVNVRINLTDLPGALSESVRAVLTNRQVIRHLMETGYAPHIIESIINEIGRNGAQNVLSVSEEID